MARRLIWIDEKEICGWGCANCAWVLSNRKNDSDLPVGQELRMQFADHDCERYPRVPKESSTRVSQIGA
jgi:hypothetical protein